MLLLAGEHFTEQEGVEEHMEYGEYASSTGRVMLAGCNQLATNTKFLVLKFIKAANKINIYS